jgi:hypothetical protein
LGGNQTVIAQFIRSASEVIDYANHHIAPPLYDVDYMDGHDAMTPAPFHTPVTYVNVRDPELKDADIAWDFDLLYTCDGNIDQFSTDDTRFMAHNCGNHNDNYIRLRSDQVPWFMYNDYYSEGLPYMRQFNLL